MPRPAELSLSRLESREVPAAALFADIRPGEWGSNPVMHGASGDTLYFSANNIYQGTELWATDGTAAGTRMVADLNPGKPGSGIYGVPAGNGVFYFIQNNEGSSLQTDYKTDGTAAGTVQVTNGIGSIFSTTPAVFIGGMKGELYYLTRTPDPNGYAVVKTDGTTTTTLGTFNGQQLFGDPNSPAKPFLPDGSTVDQSAGTITLNVVTTANQKQVWQTDGTAAGTIMQQANLTATSPTTGDVPLFTGTPLGGGRFVFRSVAGLGGQGGSLWAGDAATTRTLLRTFDGVVSNAYTTWGLPGSATAGNRLLFVVTPIDWSAPSADTGVWVTDGTPAGTTKLNVPNVADRFAILRGTFDGKAVVQAPTADPLKWTYLLTDGTATTPLPTPAGTGGVSWEFEGTIPADAANPKGGVLFQEREGTRAFRTDGVATRLVDTTGLPAGGRNMYWNDWDESVVVSSGWNSRGFYFKGAVYYPGRAPDVAPTNWDLWRRGAELWKWDLAGTTPPAPAAPPKVLSTRVNDGGAQRSMVKTLTVTFDTAVTVASNGVSILNVAGNPTHFSMTSALVNGKTVLTFAFPNGIGGSIADGRWTLRISAGAVKGVTGGRAMAADYSFVFTRVYGDTSGDGTYDRPTRMLVKALLGQQVGDPGYRWDLDVNSDGKIDAADELAAIRNWGKGV